MAALTLLSTTVHTPELGREAERGQESDHVVLHLYFIYRINPHISTTAQ